METVIKVSGNKRAEPEPKEELPKEAAPAPPPQQPEQEESTIESIIHHSWGHRHDRKEIPAVRTEDSRQHPSQWCLIIVAWWSHTTRCPKKEVMYSRQIMYWFAVPHFLLGGAAVNAVIGAKDRECDLHAGCVDSDRVLKGATCFASYIAQDRKRCSCACHSFPFL